MTARFIVGDVLDVLATLPEASVDLVLTSPPFLALRSYLPSDHPDKHREGGSQSTPADYFDWLLDVVEACARVLTPHGSLVVELGDTYSGSGGSGGDYNTGGMRDGQQRFRQQGSREHRPEREGTGADGGARVVPVAGGAGWPLAKSLTFIPQIFGASLAYGRNLLNPARLTDPWRVRNVVAWVRPNPPIGALADKFRPATSYLTVATKARDRWFDLDAVRAPPLSGEAGAITGTNGAGFRGITEGGPRTTVLVSHPAGAPPLDWWQISTQPYKGAHYATWPEQLLRIPILSMCPQKVCTGCGKPSRRVVAASRRGDADDSTRSKNHAAANPNNGFSAPVPEVGWEYDRETVGWTDCECDAPHRPGVVLDPFAGTGTTLAAAVAHGRTAIGIDLDERNVDLASQRVGMWLTAEHHTREAAS